MIGGRTQGHGRAGLAHQVGFGEGRTAAAKKARSAILRMLEARGLVVVESRTIRAAVVDDPGGDALDSVIAAVATFRALRPRVFLGGGLQVPEFTGNAGEGAELLTANLRVQLTVAQYVLMD